MHNERESFVGARVVNKEGDSGDERLFAQIEPVARMQAGRQGNVLRGSYGQGVGSARLHAEWEKAGPGTPEEDGMNHQPYGDCRDDRPNQRLSASPPPRSFVLSVYNNSLERAFVPEW